MKKYDEKKLTESKFSFCYRYNEFPEYIVLPISKLKSWGIVLDGRVDPPTHYMKLLNDVKKYYSYDDYLLILKKEWLVSNNAIAYKELITQNCFICRNDSSRTDIRTYGSTLDFALENPLAIDYSDTYYRLDDKAKIEFYENTIPDEEIIKEIINSLKDNLIHQLKERLNLIISMNQEVAERENIVRDVDEFIKTRSKR